MAISGTMTLIESITVGAAGTASILFNNIPQIYDDLRIVASVRSNRPGVINSFMRLWPNANSSGITYRALFGTGSSVSSFNQSTAAQYVGEINATTSTSSTFSNTEIYIPEYRSTAQKFYSIDFGIENAATLSYNGAIGSLWANTSAITSIELNDGLSTFVQNSTFYLYGITRIPTGAKAIGGIITDDANYWYHTFTGSGVFTSNQAITAECLVIAGGGAGGGLYGGGGGAGGMSYQQSRNIAPGSYNVLVGGGGAGTSNTAFGSNGTNSSFDTIISNGGGGGGYWNSSVGFNGQAGGSGGGGGMGGTGGQSTTGGVSNQGNTGGATGYGNAGGAGFRSVSNTYFGGGGGGAGTAGQAASTNAAGTGGNGLNTWSSWASATNTGVNGYYAGGGAGSEEAAGGSARSGGLGGGGNGNLYLGANATSGITNTGSGGGGFVNGTPAGSGGSGLVIIRYSK